MRIRFIARRWWPAVGGVESFARHLAGGLARHHDVSVLAHRVDAGPTTRLTDSLRPPPPFDPFADGAVHVERLVLSRSNRLALAPLLTQVTPGLRRHAYGRARHATSRLYAGVVGPVIARQSGPADVMHMWGGDQVASAAVAAARLLQVPLVITPFAHEGQWGDDAASAEAYRAADAVVALLDEDAAVYERLGVSRERIHVCGICSPGVQGGGGPALRERFGISGPLVLFLGVRRPYKGFDLLLEAAPRVAARRDDVTFAFVGPGPTLDAPSGAARIIDAGEAGEDERAAWLDAADLLCLPSQGEIFPVSILEAWSVRTPVLTSPIPTLSELVAKSGGGGIADLEPASLADAIVDLLADPDRLAALGQAGHDFWAGSHTVDALTRSHERIYQHVMGSRGRR